MRRRRRSRAIGSGRIPAAVRSSAIATSDKQSARTATHATAPRSRGERGKEIIPRVVTERRQICPLQQATLTVGQLPVECTHDNDVELGGEDCKLELRYGDARTPTPLGFYDWIGAHC